MSDEKWRELDDTDPVTEEEWAELEDGRKVRLGPMTARDGGPLPRGVEPGESIDGVVNIYDEDGNPVTPAEVEAAGGKVEGFVSVEYAGKPIGSLSHTPDVDAAVAAGRELLFHEE